MDNKMRILLNYNYLHPHTTGHYVKKVLDSKNISYKLKLHNELMADCNKDFDVLLTIDDGEHNFLPSMAQIKKSIWIIDTHISLSKDILILMDYDFIFCAQKDAVIKLKTFGFTNVVWLPLACDPDIHFCKKTCENIYTVGFVGNAGTNEREILLQNLKTKFSNSYIGKAKFEDMACIYSSSKVAFNKSIKKDLNMRVFEVLCSGTPLVTDYIEDIDELGLGKYITYYNNDQEIESKINYVLENLEDKKELAIKAKNEVFNKHSYKVRVDTIIDTSLNNTPMSHKLIFPFNILNKSQILKKSFLNRYLNYVVLFLVDKKYLISILKQKVKR